MTATARSATGDLPEVVDMTQPVSPAADQPIRVFLLDDHEVVRRGIRFLLEDAGGFDVVGESGSAEEAKRRIPALRPDVAILDGRLPDGSGIDVCRHVRSIDPAIAALILTSFDDDDAIFAAIMAGAAGYLLKQARGNDVVESVRQIAAGRSLPSGWRPNITEPISQPRTPPVSYRATASACPGYDSGSMCGSSDFASM